MEMEDVDFCGVAGAYPECSCSVVGDGMDVGDCGENDLPQWRRGKRSEKLTFF